MNIIYLQRIEQKKNFFREEFFEKQRQSRGGQKLKDKFHAKRNFMRSIISAKHNIAKGKYQQS
jgi:hypothetical protein